MFASETRQERAQQLLAFSKPKQHMDEVFLKVNGKRHNLWRAVYHEGKVLKAAVTKRRNKAAALKVLKKLLKRHSCVDEIVTDCFAPCKAALRKLGALKNKGRQVAQQLRREITSPVSTTRTRHATFQAHAKLTEMRLRPLLHL